MVLHICFLMGLMTAQSLEEESAAFKMSTSINNAILLQTASLKCHTAQYADVQRVI